jgi:xanthine dehydrogenase YagR molybdenum-binding subunit
VTQSAIGQPLSRVEARAKVTGTARYAAEFNQPAQAHAVIVPSTIGLGRIIAVDATPTDRLPGVLAVLSHLNAPRLPYREHKGFVDPAFGERLHVLQDDRVRFFGQPVAVVVAETIEQAMRGAGAVRIRYETARAMVQLGATAVELIVPAAGKTSGPRLRATTARGDADLALTEAAVRVDSTYVIEREHHNPMEPHATVAAWDGDRLTLWSKSQFVVNEAAEIAAIFGLPVDNVRVICPFIGGAFGTSLRTCPHVTLAALAARHVGRPVKLVLTRRQMFASTGYRPHTVQRVALGAARDGCLSAIVHEGTGETSRYEEFVEALTSVSVHLYACGNARTTYRLAPLDVSTPTYMRGPGEASGIFALESAMDELAVALGIDPIELRLRNEPTVDESRGLPFSSRSMRECYALGAARFGWQRRDPRPRSMQDGRLLVGWGMAAATYPASRGTASARARLLPDGRARIESAASDMGPGTYTSMTQVAADALGLSPEQVDVEIGRSELPPTPPHGGSMTLASVGSAVRAACLAVRDEAIRIACADEHSPLFGASAGAVESRDGRLCLRERPGQGETYRDLLARRGAGPIDAAMSSAPGPERQQYSMHAFGAVFAEVAVDPDLGTVRVRRVVGAYGAGRIVNPRLAHSQCVGGMVGGIGMALMERTVLDARDGRPVNASMADYLVPVNLDIGALEAHFVAEDDPHVNPLGAKGLGEIALVGTAPAIANAIFHATARRVRTLPIRIEALLER